MVIMRAFVRLDQVQCGQASEDLGALIERITREVGCVGCSMTTTVDEPDQPDTLSIVIRWQDAPSFLGHQRNDNYQRLMRLLREFRRSPRLSVETTAEDEDRLLVEGQG